MAQTADVHIGPKIEGLPDDHCSKPQCLSRLSFLLSAVGNNMEFKRLLICSLEIWRQRGDDLEVAGTLVGVSRANRLLGLRGKGFNGQQRR